MFRVRQGQAQQAAVADVAEPLCCAQGLFPRGRLLNRDGLQRRTVVDDVTTADKANVAARGVTGSSTTRWKRVLSPSNTSVGVESSSNGASSLADGTQSIPLCISATPSAIITSSSSISSTNEAVSASTSAELLSSSTSFTPSLVSSCIPPFPSTTLPETLMTSANLSSSASPIVSSRGLTSLSPSTSTSATSFPPQSSTATGIILSTTQARSSTLFTMSNSDTITLAPVNPTSTFAPGTSQLGSDTTLLTSPVSSTPFINPTFVSSTAFSPIPSTSDILSSDAIPSPSPFPSISAISLSSISDDNPTITSTSTSTSTSTTDQAITSSNATGALSTNAPHETSFVHQTGAIIGVTVGGAFFVFIVILSIFWACKRRRSNRSYNSSLDDILAESRVNTSWSPPLEADDDDRYLPSYGRPTPPNYSMPLGSQSRRGPFDDLPTVNGGRSGSAGSAGANGALVDFRSQPPIPQTLQVSTPSRGPLLTPSYSSNDSPGYPRPLWAPTEPLNINKLNSSQKSPPIVDSQVSAIGRRSPSSLGHGDSTSSNGHVGPGSSGETLLPWGSSNRSTVIPEPPRLVHKLIGRRHDSTPPTAFVGRESSLEYDTQLTRIQQQQQEERNQQDRANKSISQVILARIRASRRTSDGSTIKAYSQCTTIESEGSAPSRRSSNMYSPSLLNPPISMSMTAPHSPYGGTSSTTRSSYTFHSGLLPLRQDAATTSKGIVRWPDVGIPPRPPSIPSPVPTDTSSMVEGLLHPRLGMALASSQQASSMSLRDHEDYTRPINGLVNNHLRSTTTFDTQNTVDLSEGGT